MLNITKNNLENLKNGKRVRLDVPVTDTVTAHMVLSPKVGERTAIRGYLINLNPKYRITAVKEKSKTSLSYNSLPYDVRDLRNSLVREFESLNKSSARPRAIRPESFGAQVMDIADIENPDNFAKYVPRGWGKSTASVAVSYYARTFGAFYEEYGYDATEADYHSYLESEIKKIYASRYQHPCNDGSIILQRRASIYNGLMTRWSQARVVQQYLLDNHPEFDWPTTLIPVEPRYKAVSSEELKTISFQQYITVLTLLKRLCIAKVPYAYAALLEAVCGARIGESCAPRIREFEIASSYGRYYIDTQIDKSGNRTHDLKRPCSHRFVFFRNFLIDMWNLRKQQLADDGFSPEEIPDLPFASSAQNPHAFLSKQRVSSFLKEILTLAGCNQEWIKQESERLFITALATGNEDDLDVTAHLLRRTVATLLANGGVPVEAVDAVLGHENPVNEKIDYASEDKAREICAMIDRAIYLGSLCKTNNPTYTPVDISGNISAKLHGNNVYSFVVQEDTFLSLNLTCLEAGHPIKITVTDRTPQLDLFSDPVIDKQNLVSPRNAIESDHTRPILPTLPSAEEVECWINEASQIDLTEIINKWRE